MVFLYCNLQNIILGLRTEAVVKKGDGDTLSDWKPAFAWHRWNFCDHQDDQLFVVTKMINQKAVHEFCDDNKKRSYSWWGKMPWCCNHKYPFHPLLSSPFYVTNKKKAFDKNKVAQKKSQTWIQSPTRSRNDGVYEQHPTMTMTIAKMMIMMTWQ